jgi:hypothetical protein
MSSEMSQPIEIYDDESYPKETLTKIYRDVCIDAVRELGTCDVHDANAVMRWVRSDSFTICCNLASWDDGWMMDLFKAVSLLSGSVRKPITRQCLDMLRILSRLDEDTTMDIPNHLTRTIAKSAAYPADLDCGGRKLDSAFALMNKRKRSSMQPEMEKVNE